MPILFTSEHFPGDDALVRRTLDQMPGVNYARGGIHNQAWFDEFEYDTTSAEDVSFAGAKARRNEVIKAYDVADGHWLPVTETNIGRAFDVLHRAGWGNWRRETMTPWYHAFLYDDADRVPTQRQVLDFTTAAFPGKEIRVIASEDRWHDYQALGVEGMEYDCDNLHFKLMRDRDYFPMDVVIMDDIAGRSAEHLSNVCALMMHPIAFVLVVGPGCHLLRNAVIKEGGRSPKHVPRMPGPELRAILENQDFPRIRRPAEPIASTFQPL